MGDMGDTTTGVGQLPVVAVLIVAGAYGCGVLRLSQRGDRWMTSSSICFLGGVACVLSTMVVPALARPATFAQHIVAHLILVMLAPMVFALSAPVTLVLRLSSPRVTRKLLRVLHSRIVRYTMLPPVLLVLETSGMYAFYLTPLFAAAEQHPLLHLVLHVHMSVCSALLNWYLIGRDPMVRRRSPVQALVVLTTAAAAHDLLAKMMYARLLPEAAGSADQIRLGAQMLYYGGDLVEITTACILMATWYLRGGRELRRRARRANGRDRIGALPEGTGTSWLSTASTTTTMTGPEVEFPRGAT